jgi:hypothetical protein
MVMKFLCTDEIYPTNVVAGIAGLKQAGKSLYAFEQGFLTGGDMLYISTEEGSDFFLQVWKPVFEKKYNTKPKIHFQYCPNATDLLAFFGLEGELRTSVSKDDKATKMEFQTTKLDIEHSPFVELVKQANINYLVVDSVTTAFDALIIGGRQNYPLRAQLEEVFFSVLNNAIKKSGKSIYIFCTNHLTFNPTSPRVTQFHMIEEIFQVKGGKMIGHYVKLLYGLEKRERPHGYRYLHVIRYPNIPEFDKSYELLITNEGFSNTNKQEIQQIKDNIKKAKEEKKNETNE